MRYSVHVIPLCLGKHTHLLLPELHRIKLAELCASAPVRLTLEVMTKPSRDPLDPRNLYGPFGLNLAQPTSQFSMVGGVKLIQKRSQLHFERGTHAPTLRLLAELAPRSHYHTDVRTTAGSVDCRMFKSVLEAVYL